MRNAQRLKVYPGAYFKISQTASLLVFTDTVMAVSFPYTRYACPCSETATPASILGKRSSQQTDDSEDEETFNSHDPRANFSLYPLENLLFCDECNAIRCPKCWLEEMMFWYCPNCLFEVPSSGVKSDGNR